MRRRVGWRNGWVARGCPSAAALFGSFCRPRGVVRPVLLRRHRTWVLRLADGPSHATVSPVAPSRAASLISAVNGIKPTKSGFTTGTAASELLDSSQVGLT